MATLKTWRPWTELLEPRLRRSWVEFAAVSSGKPGNAGPDGQNLLLEAMTARYFDPEKIKMSNAARQTPAKAGCPEIAETTVPKPIEGTCFRRDWRKASVGH